MRFLHLHFDNRGPRLAVGGGSHSAAARCSEEMALAGRSQPLERTRLSKAAVFPGYMDMGNPPNRGPEGRALVLVLEPHPGPVFPRRDCAPGRRIFAQCEVYLRLDPQSRRRSRILRLLRPRNRIRSTLPAAAPNFSRDRLEYRTAVGAEFRSGRRTHRIHRPPDCQYDPWLSL